VTHTDFELQHARMKVLHSGRDSLRAERAALLSRSDILLEDRKVLLAEMREFTEAARERIRETPYLLLIIADEAIRALDFADSARRHGFKVLAVARDAEGAREAIAQSRPDAAIVGVHLADGPTGLALANELTLRRVPVALITGSTERARWSGQFFRKPICVADVLSALAARTMKISEPGQAVGADPLGHRDRPAKPEGSAQ
jgi:hypothetical protein